MQRIQLSVALGLLLSFATWAQSQTDRHSIYDQFDHLRIAGTREWSEFPEVADSSELDIHFQSAGNDSEWALRIRQYDVKQSWDVQLNGESLGRLTRDENDMIVYFPVPSGTLIDGENHLRIKQQSGGDPIVDDIRVGEIELVPRSVKDAVSASTLTVTVKDSMTGELLPSRITIVDENDTLQSTGSVSGDHLAVRPGLVYTSTGIAQIGLPVGTYKIYAGRGFEYSLASDEVTLSKGAHIEKTLTIHREVPTDGYVACDTHVHTLTHSGHGDATVEERMISLAAEGIELPIATDHNQHVDHQPFAKQMNVEKCFTPVIGNEVTTEVAHFNIFPIDRGARVPDHKLADWDSIIKEVFETPGVRVAILNHARDIHSGVRPFGPKRFNSVVGENLDNWGVRFNAMEVINSSATQTDPFQLFHDWMALLNRGHHITPIGCSDSHDVGRHFVGQGRTYIRCDDRDPSHINVDEAVGSLIQGRVLVSYGLLADIRIDSEWSSGDLAAPQGDAMTVSVRVWGPHWADAEEVRLYSNGRQIHSAAINANLAPGQSNGLKWQGKWTLPRPTQDVHLVAIASGPGIDQSYWKTAKPYQARSPDWTARVMACSGAVWIDGDGDGRRTSAHDYAQRIYKKAGGELDRLIQLLPDYDQAVAAHVAHLYQSSGRTLLSPAATETISSASGEVKAGFRLYLDAWRENQIARATD